MESVAISDRLTVIFNYMGGTRGQVEKVLCLSPLTKNKTLPKIGRVPVKAFNKEIFERCSK